MNILLALDLSPATEMLISRIRTLFPKQHAHITLLHVAEPEPEFVGYDPGPQTVRDQVAERCREAHARLQDIARDLQQDGYEAQALQVQGSYADCILSTSQKTEADLIAMGSHGHGAMHHLLLGSTSEHVLKKARCPVLIIPTRE
ncbi:MAG: universal stress protein [Kiritimatiellae bacterium]|jgi:nucleotide-binding universal stress UspA family protein|nr:universal stress protein [Kiritimatiellia bacterium]